MFNIEAAGLVICIRNHYDFVKDLCKEYIIPDSRRPDIIVEVTEEELQREANKPTISGFVSGYVESIAIYEKISNRLPEFDAFVMHSSVVAVNGKAYCFAAESGIGKSTHTRYWKETLGDRVKVINGDKPIYRFKRNQLIAYGTPWNGKEDWGEKISAPLNALCLLERAEENAVFPVEPFQVLNEMIHHFHLTDAGEVDVPKLIELIDRMVTTVPVYRLKCKNDVSAAKLAVKMLIKEEGE